ncbi:hypothetical protein KKI24_20530 [bacterium]|nr:hypothetical protein [bacterium]
MKNDDIREKRFLLGNVMQIAVLTHAKAFLDRDDEAFFSLMEKGAGFAETMPFRLNRSGDQQGASCEKDRISVPGGFQNAWNKIKKEHWQNVFRSLDLTGKPIPASVAISIQEALFAANPSVYFFILSTIQAGNLIQQWGDDNLRSNFSEKLFACEWSGALGIFEPGDTHHLETPRTTAVQKGDYYAVTGLKDRVIAGDHDLSTNIVHLVMARIQDGDKRQTKTGLLVVPKLRAEGSQWVDNGLRLESMCSTMGLKGVPCCRISYGAETECRGYLLDGMEPGTLNPFSDWFSQLALQGVAQTNATFFELAATSRGSETSLLKSSNDFSIRSTPALIHLKAISEGLRGAVYMTVFFMDCVNHGAASQREYFSDLFDLYTSVFTIYSPGSSLAVISKAMLQGGGIPFDPESTIEQRFRDLLTGTMVGPDENRAAEIFLEQTLPQANGRLFSQLLKQFETVETHLVMSEALNETTTIWRDFIGGLIVLFDDIMSGQKEGKPGISRLYARHILKLFGDVIICYHLIIQGMAAERILVEAGVNFYNLKQDVIKKPALVHWYNKLQTAEFFAVHILAMNESIIRLIQGKPQTVLELI